jgi:3-keto-disaccharide hydrolase
MIGRFDFQEDLMRFAPLKAAALGASCVAALTIVGAQQPTQPPPTGAAAPPAARGAQPQAGSGSQAGAQGQQPAAGGQRGGAQAQAAAPPPMPGGLPPKPAAEADLLDDKGGIPEGFTPIFNGKDLSGWHVSKTNHHGTTPDFRVLHGLIIGNQQPLGQGGILLTDKKYRNVEVYMEVKPDWGNDSGLFLRSSEAGEAYQVTLDYLPGGGMGGVYGERLQGLAPAPTPPGLPAPTLAWTDVWRRESWNSIRARIEGDVPHIQVWINGAWIRDWRDTANHAAAGATDGMIAIQIHGGGRALPGSFWRWRNIAVKEL